MFIAQYIFTFASRTPAADALIHNGKAIRYRAFAGAIARASLRSLPPRQGARVVDVENDQGQVSAVNEEGRLRVKLTELDADGYLDDAEATRGSFCRSIMCVCSPG